MIALALYLLFCLAAFGQVGALAGRQAFLSALAVLPPETRAAAFSAGWRAEKKGALTALLCESLLALALLGFESWRKSAFSSAVVLLASLWILEAASARLRKELAADPSDKNLRRLRRLGRAALAVRGLQAAILILIALA